jgi:septal ring factor EnvC (AmiA/AmiB activator)
MNNTFSLGETSIIPEDFIGPKRHVLGHLVENGLKEIAIIRVDLEDALILEGRIQEEKQHLAYLVQDLSEQEMILEFNKELQNDILKKKHELRIAQFESYKKLKETEMQVEQLIGQFNSRKELEKVEEAQRVATISARVGEFQKMKGKLLFPVSKGQVIAGFGKAFDSKSGLYVFKKGIDISTGKELPVRSVSEGKVAYSGELNGYGKVTIIDHGHQYYSLMANLGELTKRAGDNVSAGDTIGRTDDLGTPVYFEIRARNVAVNPLQWLAN